MIFYLRVQNISRHSIKIFPHDLFLFSMQANHILTKMYSDGQCTLVFFNLISWNKTHHEPFVRLKQQGFILMFYRVYARSCWRLVGNVATSTGRKCAQYSTVRRRQLGLRLLKVKLLGHQHSFLLFMHLRKVTYDDGS